MSVFKGRPFAGAVILRAVRGYGKYGISLTTNSGTLPLVS
jgi:hypothetical protein